MLNPILNRLYGDMLPEHPISQEGVGYPVWLDTVGLDKSNADETNSDLVRSYLRVLQCFKIEWVHAVVCSITPRIRWVFRSHCFQFYFLDFQKLQYLKDQAEVIKMFGEKSQNILKKMLLLLQRREKFRITF